MQITNHTNGHRYAPLDEIEITGAISGVLIVSDGARRVYRRVPASSPLRVTIGGACGRHTVLLVNEQHKLVERLYFGVEAETRLEDTGGAFAELLQMLYVTMAADTEQGLVRWNSRVYHFFARWLRDHVHALKGMKYFHAELKSAIDLYRESQRDDGMIWDNVYPRSGPNDWDARFAQGEFIRPVDADGFEFKRVPAEADVEYLFVEGLYATWQASGDDGWMVQSLDAAVRALDYSIASPLRWSARLGLIKRGYTIDTWDVQASEDALVEGDPMRIDAKQTRFGIMFGDNTGYIASCRMLATMLEHTGLAAEAARFRERAETMQARLDEVSWADGFFIHHVPEEYGLIRELGVDEDSQISLSNAYSLNRGIGQAQAAAIIGSYQALRENLPAGAPGEWYTIFPPFERGFGDLAQWQSINGGVTPIVAGELARGAFAHGFERYGVEILRRLIDLGQQHGGRFHAVYTGAVSAQPAASPANVVSYGPSDNWAAAAVVAAIVEGLAGVSDQASAFQSASLAPRWLAADIDEAAATVAYPASGGYVAYRYNHDRANRQFLLTLTGSGGHLRCRVPLPPYAQRVQVAANGGDVAHHLTTIEQSRYAEFVVSLPGPALVTVSY